MPSFLSPEPKVSCFDDLDLFKDFENEFPAIVYNVALASKSEHFTKPTLCPQHIDEFYIAYFETRLGMIYRREILMVAQTGCSGDRVCLTRSHSRRRIFLRLDAVVHELILEFFSTFRFGEGVLDLDTTEALQFQLGGARRRMMVMDHCSVKVPYLLLVHFDYILRRGSKESTVIVRISLVCVYMGEFGEAQIYVVLDELRLGSTSGLQRRQQGCYGWCPEAALRMLPIY
ncbi:hypothetical protein Tco_1473674 [Tanacetum coccineum]